MIDSHTGDTVVVEPPPSASRNAEQDAIVAAERVITAYARPSLSPEDWWADLRPLLTDSAADALAGLPPDIITTTKVTGPGILVDDFEGGVAVVDVPTDNGTLRVTMIRRTDDSPWLMTRFEEAE